MSTMPDTKYTRLGRKARASNEPRESCRFKAADIVRDWQAGWDAEDAERREHERRAMVPRWEDQTSHSRGSIDRRAATWGLRGDAPSIIAMDAGVYRGEQAGPRVSVHAWGIDRAEMTIEPGSEPGDIQRAAITEVRRILRERLAELDAIADDEGNLLAETER